MTKTLFNRSARSDHRKRLSARAYYLRYTVLFLLICAGMFLPFLLTGRSLICMSDGRRQYYPQMIYLRRYMQELLSGILSGGRPLKFYDFAIGMGEGIIVAARMHRLDVLSVFVPEKVLPVFYTSLILVRLYLSGIAFSAYCRYRKMNDHAVLIGCMVYLSCGFALQRVTMHPFFGAAMYMLPFMLLGAEKILQERKGLCMIAASAVGFLVIYYFAYMCTIAVAFYYLLRWPQVRCHNRTHSTYGRAVFFRKGFFVIWNWLIGACMAAWVLVPTFSHLFASDRVKVGQSAGTSGLYPIKYYGNLLLGLISPNVEAGFNTRLSFIALIIPVLVILFFGKLKNMLSMKLAVILQAVGLCIPTVGLVMGAFGNVSNRWTFIIAFTLALLCVRVLEEGPVYDKTSLKVLSGVTVLYTAGTAALFLFPGILSISSRFRLNIAAGCFCLLITTAAFLFMSRRQVTYEFHIRLTGAVAFLSAVVMSIVVFLPGLGGLAETYVPWSKIPSIYENQPTAVLSELTKNEFCRADTGFNKRTWLNSSLYHDYYGTGEYNSVMHSGEQHFLMDLESPSIENSVMTRSMDGRAVCENLAYVHYYLTDEDDGILPYGFEKADEPVKEGSALYRNQIPLSFAYTYDTVLSESVYDTLSAAQKQQVLMKAAVLDEEDIDSQSSVQNTEAPETNETVLPVSPDEVSVNEQCSIEDGVYSFEKDGEISLSYERRSGCECYLRLSGISYEDANEDEDKENLKITCGAGSRRVFLNGPGFIYHIPMDNRMIYLGYSSQDESDEVTVRFFGKGHCDISSLELCYIPMDSFAQDVEKRNAGGCSSPQYSTNRIEGDLENGGERFVVLPVLYSKGWKAEIDGEDITLVNANRCYTGFYVSEGKHHFTLTYMPQHFILTMIITVSAWFLFMLLAVRELIRKKSEKENKKG